MQIKTYKCKTSKITWWKPEQKGRYTETKRNILTRQTIMRQKENKGEEWERERETVVKRKERV